MANNVTVLEGIIEDVAVALYQKWYNAIPSGRVSEDSEEALALNKNAKEVTLFVIQMFMDKFNEEAERLKNED
jgi:uncharacterized protein YeaC (DUF1315 family)